jgi:hypothetical protein
MKRFTWIFIALAFTCCLVSAFRATGAHALSKFEGFYEAQLSLQRTGEQWQFGPYLGEGMPQHYFELKHLSFPFTDLESFFKLRAQSNYDEFQTAVPHEYKTPPFLAAEGHLKLRQQKWESFIFYRQNRSWLHDEPLLNLIDEDKLKNDNWGPQSSGIRADFWDVKLWKVHGLGGTLIYFDDGGTYNWTDDPSNAIADGTDNLIFRLRKNSFDNRLEIGASYLRKDWTNTSIAREFRAKSFNDVISADIAFYPREIIETGLRLGPLNLENASFITEYAYSRDPFNTETIDVRSKKHQYAIATEVREIYLSHLIIHGWYNYFGENFRSYLSRRFDEDRQFNRKQYHVEGILLMPKKAITITVAYDFHKKIFIDEEGGNFRPTHNLYTEAYVEFIKGFKGKIAYNRWHGFDASGEVFDFFTYPNLFAELSVENSVAKVRIQGRIRDFSTFREVFAYAYDMEFNATGKLKGYLRIMNVNEKTEARSTAFAQVRYDIGWGAEFFVEYGDPNQSNDMVNTDWFVNEGANNRIEQRVKMFLKIYF